MCETEHVLLAHKDYKKHCQLHYAEEANVSSICEAPKGSIAYQFYNAAGVSFTEDCPLLRQELVDDISRCEWYYYFIPEDTEEKRAHEKYCNCYRHRHEFGHSKCNNACDNCGTTPEEIKRWNNCYDIQTLGYETEHSEATFICDQGLPIIEEVKNEMKDKYNESLQLARLGKGNFLTSDILTTRRSGRTRSMLSTGFPYFLDDGKPYTQDAFKDANKKFWLEVEPLFLKHFGLVHYFFESSYLRTATAGPLRIRWTNIEWFQNEYENTLVADNIWLGGSIGFVGMYMRVHTGSWFLALMGMLQILLSLPVSYFIYGVLGGVRFFSGLHVLVLFVILGVGADDIFVLVDAWKQSTEVIESAEIKMKSEDKGTKGSKDGSTDEDKEKKSRCDCDADALYESVEHARIAYAVRRGMSTIFNTSLTTCMAFLATAVSPIMPISTFGYFAAVCIIMNYVFVCVWTPVVILFWYRHWASQNCCCCCANDPSWEVCFCIAPANRRPKIDIDIHWPDIDAVEKAKKPVANVEPEAKTKDGNDEEPESCSVEACMGGCFFECMALRVPMACSRSGTPQKYSCVGEITRKELTAQDNEGRCLPVVSLIVLVVLLMCSGMSFWQATLLTPPQKGELYLMASHTMQQVNNELVESFYASEVEQYMVVDLTWGIKGIDRTGFDQYKPNKLRGKAVFDDEFSDMTLLNSSKRSNVTHQVMLKACEIVGSFPCEGFANDKLAYPGSVYDEDRPENCWPYHFERWFEQEYPNKQFPGSAQNAYWKYLEEYRSTRAQLLSHIGFIDNHMEFASVSFASGIKWWQPSHTIRLVYDCVDALEDKIDEVTEQMFAEAGESSDGMKVMHSSRGMWVSMVTQDAIVQGLFQGLSICFPVVAAVVLINSGNLIIALYTVISIGSIVVSVLGFCKWAHNWDLGVVQSIAGIMVVGFSVDYCLHLAHMYTEAPYDTARARVQYTLSKMGATVLGGAITTFGSGFFLFGTQTTIFQSMAWLISMTIATSTLFSLGFFIAACVLLGPDGNFGNIYICCQDDKKKVDREEKYKRTYPPDSPGSLRVTVFEKRR